MINKYYHIDDGTVMKAVRKASVKYKKALDRMSKYDSYQDSDRCINCGHYYSPDELIEMESYDDNTTSHICYYCSSDIENEITI